MHANRFRPSVIPSDCCWLKHGGFIVLVALLVSFCCVSDARGRNGAPRAQDEPVPTFEPQTLDFFESKVRPLLFDRCVECHGPEKQESELRLDSRAAVLRGGISGQPAAVSGHPDRSLLIQAVHYDGDIAMPPDESLTDQEIETLEHWVEVGLPWPDEPPTKAPLTMEARMLEAQQTLWSLQPITPPHVPIDAEDDWSYNAIDRIVWKTLKSAQLTPAADASPRVLLRRLKFGLLGLPVTEEEVRRFEMDGRPDAVYRWVDRYLADPAFGERWGRHWLDVARYGDTRGYAFARDRRYPYAFTYRDYVIRALNEDKPYDRFVIEQLAADQLELPGTDPDLAALGFLTTGRRYNNPHDDIDDQIDVVSRGLLGLTVACARCHDHKYDAIPTEDYYSLYGVFASCSEPGDLPLIGEPSVVANYQTYLDRLNQQREATGAFVREHQQRLMEHARRSVTDYFLELMADRAAELSSDKEVERQRAESIVPAFLNRWREFVSQEAKPNHPVFGVWSRLTSLKSLDKFPEEVAAIESELRQNRLERVNGLIKDAFLASPPSSLSDLAELYGRVFTATHERWVEMGSSESGLAKMSVDEQQIGLALYDTRSPTRLTEDQVAGHLSEPLRQQLDQLRREVAEIESESPPEVPRAMVVHDRDQPVQPVVFIRGQPGRRGESVERQFVGLLSGEDRQPFTLGSGRLELARRITEEANPLTARVIVNRIWMHHFGEPLVDSPSDFGVRSDRPVQAELLDYLAWRLMDEDWSQKAIHRMIVTSHVYQQSSVHRPDCAAIDPDNRLLWKMNRRVLEFEPMRDALLAVTGELDRRMFGPSQSLVGDASSHRRAIYGTVDRQDLPNLFRVFDFASPDQSTARRPETIVPQQALFLMNSPFVLQRARVLGKQVPWLEDQPATSIERIFQTVLARRPSAIERQMALEFLDRVDELDEQTKLSRWEQLCHLVLLTNEFAYVD